MKSFPIKNIHENFYKKNFGFISYYELKKLHEFGKNLSRISNFIFSDFSLDKTGIR